MSYYPESPKQIPERYTQLTNSYKFRSAVAIVSIALFFALYFMLIYGVYQLLIWSINLDIEIRSIWVGIFRVAIIVAPAMLLLFTIKFLFKLTNPKPTNRVEINLKEQPKLKEFIYSICKETGAPTPRKVFVDPDVNAYVAYSNPWLSLIFPTKKDLTFGLGLVDCLNLSEFKAVVAHEFGHFAQRSMKVGSYIMSANTIISDMIFNRDKWDLLLANWRSIDIRLSAVAWILTGIVWVIRQALFLFYKLLNIMYLSLSREMEFNADRVAASVAGSEPVASSLHKLGFGDQVWNNTMNHLYIAAQKNIYTNNFFNHNSKAIEESTNLLEELKKAMPLKNGRRQYFSDDESAKTNMYASHPSNRHREENVHAPFLDVAMDFRSPWVLFEEPQKIQQLITDTIYREYLKKEPNNKIAHDEFNKFIEAETYGTEIFKEYNHSFENRYFQIPNQEVLDSSTFAISDTIKNIVEKQKQLLEKLYGPIAELDEYIKKVYSIADGTLKENSLKFKGVVYKKKDMENALNHISIEKESLLNTAFVDWDKEFCTFHYTLAKDLNKTSELSTLYSQHRGITSFYSFISNCNKEIIGKINNLQGRNDISEYEISSIKKLVATRTSDINSAIQELQKITFCPLPNIDSVEELQKAICPKGEIAQISQAEFEQTGFETFFLALNEMMNFCLRVEQKNLAKILILHKELQELMIQKSSEKQ